MSHDEPADEFTDDLLGESLGYTDIDWDALDEAETDRHDEIIGMSLEEVRPLKLGTLTDLQRWAVAQVYADNEEFEAFERIARELINGPAEHPALDYAEIGTELLHDLLAEDRLDEAKQLLDRVNVLCDDGGLTERRFLAILSIIEGREDEGLERFEALVEEAGTDSMLLFDLAADMAHCGLFQESANAFEEVANLALADNDPELAEVAKAHHAEVLEIMSELGEGGAEA